MLTGPLLLFPPLFSPPPHLQDIHTCRQAQLEEWGAPDEEVAYRPTLTHTSLGGCVGGGCLGELRYVHRDGETHRRDHSGHYTLVRAPFSPHWKSKSIFSSVSISLLVLQNVSPHFFKVNAPRWNPATPPPPAGKGGPAWFRPEGGLSQCAEGRRGGRSSYAKL